jgi:hypothetical protein
MAFSDRVTEILHEPLKEVDNEGALLKMKRLNGESEETWRTRVAYKMMQHIYKAENKIMSPKVLERIKNIELKAEEESKN